MTYNNYYYVNFHQVYNNIIVDLYIQNLFQCLKQYITHCFKYLHYQTVKHTLYKALQLIIEFVISFHIIITDFIFKFSKISSNLNIIITIICKFFKKMKFIFSKKT